MSIYEPHLTLLSPDMDLEELMGTVRRLAGLLDMDSYHDMDDQHAQQEALLACERQLAASMTRPAAEELAAEDPEIVLPFLQAYLLEGLYPDSVGDPEEILSSIELQTLPHFRARRMSVSRRVAIFHALREKHGLSPIDAEPALNAAYVADCKLHLRRTLVDQLRLRYEKSGGDREGIKALFDRFFPGNPLQPEDVDVVITRTALYWVVPDRARLVDNPAFLARSAEEQDAVSAFLKTMGRFAFQYFSHFPTFSSFDIRDAEPGLVEELIAELHLPRHHVVQLVNASVSIERREVIEKYLLHDTWGHMWQGDLTGLGQLYDRMESLKAPVEALEPLTIDHNVVSLLDILYLDLQGQVQFDPSLAEPFIEAWIRQRTDAMFAPIVAELTADMVEYKYRLDHADDPDRLPSSSVFRHQPCKLDFAWVDLKYFTREVGRANEVYWKDEALRANLVARIVLLLKLKYPRQAQAIDPDTFAAQVEERVGDFLDTLRARQAQALDMSLPSEHLNAFALILLNLLQSQCTLNHLVEKHLVEEGLTDYFNVLVIFVATYYVQNPAANFWSLDEAVASHALPLIREIREVEGYVPE